MAKRLRGYGLSADEAAKLRAANIDSADALWARAAAPPDDPLEALAAKTGTSVERLWAARGANPGEPPEALAAEMGISVEQLREALDPDPDQPLAKLSADAGLPVQRLREVLAAGTGTQRRRVPQARPGWASRHWLDIVLAGGLALIAWLALTPEKPEKREPFAKTLGPVAAFQVIRPADITETTAVAPDSAVRRKIAHGRVVLRDLKAGEPVTSADLGPPLPPEALAGRAILALSTRPAHAPVSPRAGSRVGVVLSPHPPGGGTGAIIRDVLVLSAARTDSTLRVVVAVPEADLSAAAALLGSSEVHLVASPPAP
jgi:hypothetical protein